MTSRALLEEAEALLAAPGEWARVPWQRTVALMARQALEGAVTRLVEVAAPDAGRAPMRPQLLCLPVLLDEAALAREAYAAWHALSEACHFHGYELHPTLETLREQVGCVRRLMDAADARALEGNASAVAATDRHEPRESAGDGAPTHAATTR